jgi:hypothetical protein
MGVQGECGWLIFTDLLEHLPREEIHLEGLPDRVGRLPIPQHPMICGGD